jgi:hypothetical protein
MPRVIGGRRATYLLLSGITVQRSVRLAPGIELMPLSEWSSPRPLLGGLDLIDTHFAMLALPWIDSQLKVSGAGSADVATRAWNALWDAMLLSALFDVPVNCSLQSTAAIENFTDKSRINVVHYRVYEPPAGRGLAIPEEDCSWLEGNFEAAQALLTGHGFQNAVHCLATYRWHSLPRAQLALIWAGIEGLFGVDSEIVFRVSLYSAKFLAADDPEQQRVIFNDIKRLYGVRSKAVHGGKLKGDPLSSVAESASLLSRLIRTCIERRSPPVIDALVL